MVAHDVLDDARYAHAPPSKDADDSIKTLSQINAAKSALHGCGKVVLEGHIKHCVRDGIEHGDADKTIENFTKAVERFSNMG